MQPDDRKGNCRSSQVRPAPVHLAVIRLRAADCPLARNALRRWERQQVHSDGWPDGTIPVWLLAEPFTLWLQCNIYSACMLTSHSDVVVLRHDYGMQGTLPVKPLRRLSPTLG